MVTISSEMTLPGSRRPPQAIDPMPPEPPATKPPTVAVLAVEGCRRSSCPEWARVATSMSCMSAPASTRTAPGLISTTLAMPDMSRTTPRESGMA